MSGSALMGELYPQEQTMDDFVSTTIYFDGQFWSALIEKKENGMLYTGRYIFGAEPSHPRLLNWMLYEFAGIPLFPAESPVRIRVKSLSSGRSSGSLCKSLDVFKAAQASYFTQKKQERRRKCREDRQSQWEAAQIKKKEKKRH
jgi:hypothetical protein